MYTATKKICLKPYFDIKDTAIQVLPTNTAYIGNKETKYTKIEFSDIWCNYDVSYIPFTYGAEPSV